MRTGTWLSRRRASRRAPAPPGASPWVTAEPGMAAAVRELARLGRRGVRRPVIVAAAAFLVTALAGAAAWRRPPHHHVQRVLRVTETRAKHPTATRDVRGFIEGVAFTNEKLLGIIRKHHVTNLDRPGADPIAAIEDLRDSLKLEVVRNPTIALLPPEERPNATRVVIRYESPDPEEAVAVADELVQLIVGAEGRRVVGAAAADERAAGVAVEAARRDLEALRRELLRDPERSPGELADLAERTRAAQAKVATAEAAYAEASVQARVAHERVGLEFEVVPPAPAAKPMPRKLKTVVVSGLALVLGLPLCLLVVAAFDPRIYFEEDLARLGLAVLGHVPPPPRGEGTAVTTVEARAHA